MIDDTKILIVDDSSSNRLLLRQIFSSEGFKHIDEAVDGEDAIKKIIDIKPELVLLDIVMPKKDGFAVLKELKDMPQLHDMVIILQTGADKPEDKQKAFESGATDFISKPIYKREVMARSLAHLEKYYMMKDLKVFNKRIKEELTSAIALQRDTLPSEELINQFRKKYSTDMASYYQPCSELGGDFWGLHLISDTKYAVYNVDFSGHGITSALNTFRLQTILQNESLYNLKPAKFLETINSKLYKMLPTGQFATMFYGIVDTASESITYATAASPPSILLSKGSIKILTGKGFPLGIVEDPKYKNTKISFAKDDRMLLYSDALIEASNAKGQFLTQDDISALLLKTKDKTCDIALVDILHNFRKWTNGSVLDDDLTLVIFSLK